MPATSVYSTSPQHLGLLLLPLSVDSSGPCPPPPFPPFSLLRWSCIMLSMMAASAVKRFSATRSTAVKRMLNINAASTHLCRRLCFTSNISEHSPSSSRTHAHMLSWNSRMTACILGGRPKRANTVHKRVRSTEPQPLVRSYITVGLGTVESKNTNQTKVSPIHLIQRFSSRTDNAPERMGAAPRSPVTAENSRERGHVSPTSNDRTQHRQSHSPPHWWYTSRSPEQK